MHKSLQTLPFPSIAAMDGPFQLANPRAMAANAAGACASVQDTPKGRTGFFGVPLDHKPVSSAIRAHEYGHLALESLGVLPKDSGLRQMVESTGDPSLGNLAAQSILDVLVNRHLLSNGVTEVRSLPFPPYCNRRAIDITTYIRALGVKTKRASKVMSKDDTARAKTLYKTICKSLKSKIVSQDALVGFTKSLYGLMQEPPKPPVEQPKPEPSASGKAANDKGESPSPSPSPIRIRAIPASIQAALDGNALVPMDGKPVKPSKKASRFVVRVQREPGYWVPMSILDEPITQLITASQRNARRVKPGFVGPLRYPVRALIPAFDGSCFGLPQRSKGGTMLIDLSGSMHLETSNVASIVAQHPHVTIAGYSGQYASGSLVVLARNGRMIPSDKLNDIRRRMGGGNCCDGPALQWLSRQRGPRVWICDGLVTGVNDLRADNLDTEALKLKQNGRITQYKSISKFLAHNPVPHNTIT